MFYDKRLMNSKTIGSAWRAANNVSTETDEDEIRVLSKICNKIDRWVGNDVEEVEGRMSLRTSSTLVGGVAKLYKTGLEQLLDDANKLNDDMSRRKRRLSTITGSSESNTASVTEASDTAASPEEMRRHIDKQMVTSITPKKHKTISVSPKMVSMEHVMDRSSSEHSRHRRSSVINDGDRFSGLNILSPQDIENTNASSPKTKDQETQTTTLLAREGNTSGGEFNADLPFGYIIIHDSYSSRIPRTIIFSSINADINQLTN